LVEYFTLLLATNKGNKNENYMAILPWVSSVQRLYISVTTVQSRRRIHSNEMKGKGTSSPIQTAKARPR
jgi:hypothetical protein